MNRFTAAAIRCAAGIYRAFYATLRVTAVLPDGTRLRARDYAMGGHIFAVCEGDALALGGLMADRRFAVLVAHGRDGDWAAALLTGIGCRVIRGSTRRGGTGALLALLRHMERSEDPVAIVVDGPLGPAGVAKPGAIVCGLKSGRPVRALGVAARWKLTVPRTWSGIYLPLPFTSLIVTVEPSPDIDRRSRNVAAGTRALNEHLASARQRANAVLGARLSS